MAPPERCRCRGSGSKPLRAARQPTHAFHRVHGGAVAAHAAADDDEIVVVLARAARRVAVLARRGRRHPHTSAAAAHRRRPQLRDLARRSAAAWPHLKAHRPVEVRNARDGAANGWVSTGRKLAPALTGWSRWAQRSRSSWTAGPRSACPQCAAGRAGEQPPGACCQHRQQHMQRG